MEILVASCWKYRDTWSPFAQLMNRFWPDHSPMTLVSDLDFPLDSKGLWDQYHRTVSAGKDLGWSKNLLHALQSHTEKHVLLFQDDFFLSAPAHNDLILDAYGIISRRPDIGFLRLYPCPGADLPWAEHGESHPMIGEIHIQANYKSSCQVAIWRRDYLVHILDHTDSASSFEMAGTLVAQTLPDTVLSVRRDFPNWPLQYLCSAISRGQWNPDALTLCKRENIAIDLSLRPIEGG